MSYDSEIIDDFPVVTYTNRLQRLMYIVSISLLQKINFNQMPQALRTLIINLPPKAKIDLKEEMSKLSAFEKNTSIIKDWVDVENIYSKVSDWIYLNLLQDAFKFKPRNPRPKHIISEDHGE